jgi:UDP:flavonoid glycosyltransferase YjiC (YdhE family)
VLAYPFAFDQADNAQRAVEWGAAVRIDRRTADAATIGVGARAAARQLILRERRSVGVTRRFSRAAPSAPST